MDNILIKIKDHNKGQHLLEFLRDLDFVELEEIREDKDDDTFANAAGIWKDNPIDLKAIRQKAWKHDRS